MDKDILTQAQSKELQKILDNLRKAEKSIFAKMKMDRGTIKINHVVFDLLAQKITVKYCGDPRSFWLPDKISECGEHLNAKSFLSINRLLDLSSRWEELVVKFERAALKAEARMQVQIKSATVQINKAKMHLKSSEG